MIIMENYKEDEKVCNYYLPCGYCELKKKQCSMYSSITYPKWDTTPIPTSPFAPTEDGWKVGDWPPGPQPTCKDLASNPDTFRVHFEDLPKYSDACTSTSKYNPNITAEANNFNLNGVKQKLTNEK